MTIVIVSAVQVFLSTEGYIDSIKRLNEEYLFLNTGSLILHEIKINEV